MRERVVEGFLPSRNGFHFANRWPKTPAFWFGIGYLHVGVGNVADGLCGGMCFVARDRFEAGLPPPSMTEPPPAGTPLFDEIAWRQLTSFDRLVRLPLRFWSLAALHPEPPRPWSRALGLASRAVLSARTEWPKIRAQIDAGELPMLGLLRSASANPLLLSGQHQVMAWGYRVDRGSLAIRIYDPNWPDRDDVELDVTVDDGPSGPTVRLAQSTGEPLLGFFLARYEPPRSRATATG
jgi:hypothetical protein